MIRWRRRVRRRRMAAEFAARVTAARAHQSANGAAAVKPALPFELVDGAPQSNGTAVEPEPVEAPVAEPERIAPPPQDPAEDLLYRAAREATERGDLDRACGVYRELVQRNPRHLSARNSLAMVLATLGRYGDAERDLRHIVDLDPTNAEAHLNLGLVVSRKGRWVDAIPHLRRAIELDAGRELAHFYLGEALNHVDDLPGALQAYQRAAELRPNNSKALYGLGIILDRMNRPDDAAQMYRRSRELAGR